MMRKLSILTLKALRKIYAKAFHIQPLAKPECIQDADKASQLIYDKLMSDKPCMIARFGAFELTTIVNYLGVHQKESKSIIKYIQGKQLDWWWNKKLLQFMQTNAGFFPSSIEKIEQFCKLMLVDMKEVDILGSWLANEQYFEKELSKAEKVRLVFLTPFWDEKPWTRALEGKKVLIVHPFDTTIQQQYKKRKLLFKNLYVLPQFELKTLKAVQSLGGNNENGFKDWFGVLDYMKKEIDKLDYDICLLGCGAYGFPLAAHIKRKGKKSVHVGGGLQLLFGIRGKRWENPNYNDKFNFAQFMNEYWVKPLPEEMPKTAQQVENACYW